ncbi:chaperonin 10-like protein [Lipomyces chichibuensis]|uniref:chaperonin 10-like protein n=1 Tax=Lipomyces chichibuensis TaxID=1546026 RepID=UPI0033431718
MPTMKEAIVYGDPLTVEIVDSPIPTPGDNEVLIKVEVSGSNPKDWKAPLYSKRPHNSGDDIAGTIVAVGKFVLEFRPNDRVAALMGSRHGSFAEYAIAYAYTTFHIPDSVTFEEAATIPLTSLTAAYGLWDILGLPTPWRPATDDIPLLIYGASTSVGTYAIKLAKLAGIRPIIGVAGSGAHTALEAGADFVVDYRNNLDIAGSIRAHLTEGQRLLYAWDTVSEGGSYQHAIKACEPGLGLHRSIKAVEPVLESKLCLILPEGQGKFDDIDKTKTKFGIARVASAHGEDAARRDFAYIFYRQITKWLQEGKFAAHPFDVVEGGLAGVAKGLNELKDGKVSGSKNIFRIRDTPGL